MKVCAWISIAILLLIGAEAFAQTPSIDSLLIDESKGILSIFGKFGAIQGTATCDGKQLPVVSWSDTLVSTTIPDSGTGSVGPVLVTVNSQESNEQLISLWQARVYNDYRSNGVRSALYMEDELLVKFRMDIQSILSKTSIRIIDPLRGATYRLGYYHQEPYQSGKGYGYSSQYYVTLPLQYDSIYTFGMRCKVLFFPKQPKFNVQVGDIRGVYMEERYIGSNGPFDTTFGIQIENVSTDLYLDSSYQIRFDSVDDGHNFRDIHVKAGSAFHLPQNTIALKYQPTIVGPQKGSTNLPTSEVFLRWNRIPYTSNYQVQVSLDSLVNSVRGRQVPQGQMLLDTVVATTQLLLPPLEKTTKYFWRVRGVYDDTTKGVWSSVSNFTTGVNADVTETVVLPSLAIYPNPAQERTILRFALSDVGNVSCSMYDILGRELWNIPKHQFGTGDHELICDLKDIPAGQYLFKLSVDAKQSTAVLIKR